MADWLLRLEHLRYAPSPTDPRATLRQLRRDMRQIRWPVRQSPTP